MGPGAIGMIDVHHAVKFIKILHGPLDPFKTASIINIRLPHQLITKFILDAGLTGRFVSYSLPQEKKGRWEKIPTAFNPQSMVVDPVMSPLFTYETQRFDF